MFDARDFLGSPEARRLLNVDTGGVPEWEKLYELAYDVGSQKLEVIP